MQTTLDCISTSSEPAGKTTLNYSDDYIEYLYRNFSLQGQQDAQIEAYLKAEKEETDEIKRRYEEFIKSEKSSKSQKYIRVGRHNDA